MTVHRNSAVTTDDIVPVVSNRYTNHVSDKREQTQERERRAHLDKLINNGRINKKKTTNNKRSNNEKFRRMMEIQLRLVGPNLHYPTCEYVSCIYRADHECLRADQRCRECDFSPLEIAEADDQFREMRECPFVSQHADNQHCVECRYTTESFTKWQHAQQF
jgi:hypothetical protein